MALPDGNVSPIFCNIESTQPGYQVHKTKLAAPYGDKVYAKDILPKATLITINDLKDIVGQKTITLHV